MAITEPVEERWEPADLEVNSDTLGVKIGTKEEAMWTDFRDNVQKSIETLEKELVINKAIVELANKKIDDEAGLVAGKDTED